MSLQHHSISTPPSTQQVRGKAKPRRPGARLDPLKVRHLTMGPELPGNILDQFLTAVTDDNIEAFTALLDIHFPDRTQVNAGGSYRIYELNPALDLAARTNRAAILDALLAFPFHTYEFIARDAIRHHAKDALIVMLKHGLDLNEAHGATGITMLASAISEMADTNDTSTSTDANADNDRDMIVWLIEHGADPNKRPYVDTTAMSMAAEHAPPDLLRELLDDYGGDVHRGQLLHHTLNRPGIGGDEDTVQTLGLLLERGAPLNMTMYAGDPPSLGMYCFMDFGTPLHKAAAAGRLEIVKFLLAKGADTSIASSKTKTTALQWAEEKGHDDVAAVLRAADQHKL